MNQDFMSLSSLISLSMAAISCDSTVHTCPQAKLLAIHGFPFLSYNYEYGALRGDSSRESAGGRLRTSKAF